MKFEVGELNRHTFLALGCKIGQLPDGFITVKQSTKSDAIDAKCLQTHETRKRDLSATDADTHSFWRVLG